LLVCGLALFAVASAPAHALGLGRMELRSALDEPLVATVPIHNLNKKERASLKATLASREQFVKAGIPRPQHLAALRFDIESGAAGDQISITSQQPVKEPFLHFLVQVEWSGGRLVKEFTALLDPPLYVKGKAPQVTPAPTPALVPEPGQPEPAATPAPQAPSLLGPPQVGQGSSYVYDISSTDQESNRAGGEEPQLTGAAPAQIGPTRKGDTLWSFARDLAPMLGASEFQIMLSLLRANPDAFNEGNINRLKVGKILAIPSAEEVQAITKKEARSAYVEQHDEWQHYKLKLAEQTRPIEQPLAAMKAPLQPEQTAPSESPAAPGAGEQAAAGTDGKQAAETAAAPMAEKAEAAAPPAATTEQPAAASATKEAAAPEAQLKIVQAQAENAKGAPGAGKEGAASDAKEKAGLRTKISTLEEAVVSGEMENKELRERLKILEEQVANAQRLISMQDKDLALAQQQATQAQQQASEVQQQAAAAQQQVVEAQQQVAEAQRQMAEDQQQAMQVPAAEPMQQQGAQPEAAGAPSAVDAEKPAAAEAAAPETSVVQPAPVEPIAKPEPVEPAPKPAPKETTRVTQRTEPTGGMLNDIKRLLPSNWPVMVGGAGAGILLLVVGLWIYRRRRSIAEFEESILSGSALDSRTHTTPSEQVPSGTDTSFLSDFGVPGMGSMHADEVDPLAEAEVYLAYGRSEQAEEVLREAANKNPKRPEIKLKLLEIYEQRKDLKSFETLAEELYPAQGGESDPVWARVVDMGRRMNPNNPLFKASAAPPAPAVAAARAPAAAGAGGDTDLEPFPDPDHQGHGLDLDLDDIGVGSSGAAPQSLDFDDTLGPDDDLLETSAEKAPAVSAGKPEIPGIRDVDLDLGVSAAAPAGSADTLKLQAQDERGGTLDFEDTSDSLGGAGDQGLSWDEPETVPTAAGGDGEVEFDLGLPDDDLESTTATTSLEADTTGGGNGNGGDDGNGSQWDEAATKLDLARAYIDMGDDSGARSILDEVMVEGNAKQKQQASELAAQLGA